MKAPACAPNRRARQSASLGRSTCLTLNEEREAVDEVAAGGSTTSLTDRELARSLGKGDILRPPMPSEWSGDPKTWLSNIDINAVMEQYARVSRDFLYLGTWPTDFAERIASGKCVSMCTPEPFRKAYKTGALAASIINLDVHTGSGTHWVAFALDCRGGGTPKMLFYDATGRPPPKRWAKKSAWAVVVACVPDARLRRKMLTEAVYNREVHQRENTECGIFSMMCVDALVAGRPFEEHCSLALADDDAFKHRQVFFEFPEETGTAKVGTSNRSSNGARWSWAQLFGAGRPPTKRPRRKIVKRNHRSRT